MNINNYIDRNLPNTVKIQNKPTNKPPVPFVNDGYDKTANNYSISPEHMNETNLSYCNILPPSPRSQLANYPSKDTMCPTINPKPYTKNSCYLVNNNDQGVKGLVCNNAGGSNNSNFQRGNNFSNDYYMLNQHLDEYTIETPVQTSMDVIPPIIVYEPSNFYPVKTIKNNPWYRTYPTFQNYTSNGLPTYKYPSPVLNSNQKADGTVSNCINGSCVIEGFDGIGTFEYKNLLYFSVIILLIIIIIYFF